MRKYASIAAIAFKTQLAYRMDVLMNALFSLSRVLLARILWGAVFAGRETVGGFTLDGMIAYYIVQSFFSQMDLSEGISGELSGRIRDGSFSMRMTLPVRPFGLFAAQTAGSAAFYLGFNLLAAAAWTALFGVRLPLTGDPRLWLAAAATLAVGLLFLMQLHFFIGVMAFRFLDVWMFSMLTENLLRFATGSLIPLSLLPQGVVTFLRWTPVYSASYLPTMLLMGRCADQIAGALACGLCWNAALAILNERTYARMRVRYDGVGA